MIEYVYTNGLTIRATITNNPSIINLSEWYIEVNYNGNLYNGKCNYYDCDKTITYLTKCCNEYSLILPAPFFIQPHIFQNSSYDNPQSIDKMKDSIKCYMIHQL